MLWIIFFPSFWILYFLQTTFITPHNNHSLRPPYTWSSQKVHYLYCTGTFYVRGLISCEEIDCLKCDVFSLFQTSLCHIVAQQAILEFTSTSPKQLISNYCIISLRSPDTTLSRYDISWMPSYVSFPSCLLSTCRISALRLCWISVWNASSYRAKLRVLAEVS
jgi:hypothetical protein